MAAAGSVGLVGMTATVKGNTRAVKKAADKATVRTMPQAGAYIRGVAKRLIKKRVKASLPGNPPHTHNGGLKRAIRFDLGPDKASVVIGPARESAGRLWNVLEYGGRGLHFKLSERVKVGGHGPIRMGKRGRRPVRVEIRTPAQAARARAMLVAENARRAAAAKATIAPRPFMRPALIAARPVIPHHWRNTVRGR